MKTEARATSIRYVSVLCQTLHHHHHDTLILILTLTVTLTLYCHKVNISANKTVMMAKLAFDGATKRNKPELKKGDVVYCRVSELHAHLDPQLSCMAPANGGIKKDWSSGEALYRELRGGVLVRVSSATARGLLHPKSAVLTRLGSHLPFEVAVGANGLVWLRGSNMVDTVVLRNAIANCGGLSSANANAMVDAIVAKGKEKGRELNSATA